MKKFFVAPRLTKIGLKHIENNLIESFKKRKKIILLFIIVSSENKKILCP